MSKHTPGPWSLQQCPHGGAILLRGDSNERHVQSHLQIVPIEDANLISAAPDLLEALMELRSYYIETTGFQPVLANRAINKAKGETP